MKGGIGRREVRRKGEYERLEEGRNERGRENGGTREAGR